MHQGEEHVPYQFDLYTDRLPKSLHIATRSFVHTLMDTLSTHEGVVLQVVAYAPRRWDFRPSSIELHSVAPFKSRFHFVDNLAKLLAPAYLQQMILPLVLPYSPEQWSNIRDFAPSVYLRLGARGIRSFASTEWR